MSRIKIVFFLFIIPSIVYGGVKALFPWDNALVMIVALAAALVTANAMGRYLENDK